MSDLQLQQFIPPIYLFFEIGTHPRIDELEGEAWPGLPMPRHSA